MTLKWQQFKKIHINFLCSHFFQIQAILQQKVLIKYQKLCRIFKEKLLQNQRYLAAIIINLNPEGSEKCVTVIVTHFSVSSWQSDSAKNSERSWTPQSRRSFLDRSRTLRWAGFDRRLEARAAQPLSVNRQPASLWGKQLSGVTYRWFHTVSDPCTCYPALSLW